MASSPRIDDLRKKFEENPRRYFAPLANEYRKAGEIEQAIAICREHLPQQPGHMSGHIVFGQALYEARLFDESKTVFETALTLDPENLIALRHLGDIALLTGDNDTARGWYRRVLDADPRNEEIQSQLAMLDKSTASAPASRTPEPPTVPAASAATPLSTTVVEQRAVPKPPSPTAATVVASAVPRPAAAPRDEPVDRPLEAITPESPTKELRPDEIVSPSHAPAQSAPTTQTPAVDASGLSFEPTSMSPEPAPPRQSLGIESHMASAAAPPAPGGLSFDGLETTSLAGPPPTSPTAAPAPPSGLPDLDFGDVPTPPPTAPVAPPAVRLDETPSVDLDFSPPAASPAPATTAVAAPPTIDLDFSPPSAHATPVPEPAHAVDLQFLPPEPVRAAAAPAPAAIDLDFTPAASPTPARAPEPTADLPMLDVELEAPTPAPSATREPGAAASPARAAAAEPESPTPVPFVTETMAELYLKQGHREKALEVYRAVLSQRPNDSGLRARIEALEGEEHALAHSAALVHAGPSIRDVLNTIALRRPGYRASGIGTNGATPVVADAFSMLFGGAQPNAADEIAAVVLATTFATNGDGAASAPHQPAAIAGEPARPASGELSLDAVFGASAATGTPAASASDFALNQYFSAKATGEHAVQRGGQPTDTRDESPEEVAKFTQWLEGLKRR